MTGVPKLPKRKYQKRKPTVVIPIVGIAQKDNDKDLNNKGKIQEEKK